MINEVPKRIQLIDALRGLCVVLMVLHHLMFDLVEFLGAPEWLFTNPVLDIAHYFFAGMFIFLSGVSSRFSRSNVRRGIKVVLAALVISAVTWFLNMPIIFGILHFLGFSMIFYGLTGKLWQKIPDYIAPFLFIALIVLSAIWVAKTGYVKINWLWMFGFRTKTFYSSDYFPILPWIFVFLLGTWAGQFIREGYMPKWFYEFSPPVLPAIGRKAFIVYLAHQPILYGIVMLIQFAGRKM